MIHNRKSFMSNLQNKLGKDSQTVQPERKWSYTPQWEVLQNCSTDELVEALREQCLSIHTTFIESSVDEVGGLVRGLVEEKNGKKVIFPNDERLHDYGVLRAMDEWDGTSWTWDVSKGDANIQFAEQADFGIVVSDQTLAESGTCVLHCDKDKPRSVSLLPHKFIAIIPRSTIVQRLTQATKAIHDTVEKGNIISSCINFVTGPSNSADIEMNLVVGVHGPVEATYVVV